jgi:hypothetical protein
VNTIEIGNDVEGSWEILSRKCPNCMKNIYYLRNITYNTVNLKGKADKEVISQFLIRPKIANRPPVPIEVPQEFASDYREACLVIADSPKAMFTTYFKRKIKD